MSKSPLDGSVVKSLNLLTSIDSADVNEVQKNFCERVRTFIDDQKWIKRPANLSPAVCAQYGWKCVSSQLLECVTCSAKLCPGQPDMSQFELYKACVEKVQKCLKQSHTKHCPWPLTPCPANFVHMLPMHKDEAFQQFIKRVESLLILEDQLPVIADAVFEKMEISKEDCKALCTLCHVAESTYSVSAILLASTGWTRESDMGLKKYIACKSCQRNVGLMLYLPVSSTAQDPSPENGEQNSVKALGDSKVLETKSNAETELQQNENAHCENIQHSESNAAENCVNGKAANKSESNVVVKENAQHNNSGKKKNLESTAAENCVKGKAANKSESGVVVKENAQCNNSGKKNNLESYSEIEPPTKKIKLSASTLEPFDPLYEHRPWCLWVSKGKDYENSGSNSGVEVTSNADLCPGWKLFIKCLLRNLNNSDASSPPDSSPSKQEFSNARNMLESWGSPV